MLFVACFLYVVCRLFYCLCLLCVVCVARLPMCVDCCLWLVVCCLLFGVCLCCAHGSLFVVGWFLLVVRHLLHVARFC